MTDRRDREDRDLRQRLPLPFSVSVPVFFFGVLFCVALFVGSSCGKKGDPRAPGLVTPETIRDLKTKAGRKGIVLTWSRPLRYADGRRLRDLAGFVIFRKDISSACPQCPVPYRKRTTIHVEDQEKFMKKRKFRFVDRDLTPQTIYRYRVFSRLLDGSLSNPSNEAGATWSP